MKRYYPMMLDICGKVCLVVGGGRVAERKVVSLLEAGAAVRVVSMDVSPKLEAMACRGEIELTKRAYQSGDSKGCPIVFAATNFPDINEEVFREAAADGAWVNVANRPDLSSFTVPSVIRRGKLLLSVSTGGASPSVSKRIADELEAAYGVEYEIYLDFLSDMRLKVQSRVKDTEIRQQIFKRMLDWDLLGKIRDGTFESWKQKLDQAMELDPTLQETVLLNCNQASSSANGQP
jgi:precorrin-2 dehydrogenase/sirohydrochlorin ferrochelatase